MHRQTGPWGAGAGRSPGPRSPPHAPPWAGASLERRCSPPGSLPACSVGLAVPTRTSLWMGRGCSGAQASAPQSRPQKPRGRTEALREEGHAGLTGRRAGVHTASGPPPSARPPGTSCAQDPAHLLRPRRPLKTDGAAPQLFRDAAHGTETHPLKARASVAFGLFIVSRTFPLHPRVPVSITAVVPSSCPPTLPAPGAHALPLGVGPCAASTHVQPACKLRGSSFTPRRDFEVPFSLFLQAPGPASSLELRSAPCVDELGVLPVWTDHVLFIDSSANSSALFPPAGCWYVCDDTCTSCGHPCVHRPVGLGGGSLTFRSNPLGPQRLPTRWA